jgi:archaeal flagellar protein FlaJ
MSILDGKKDKAKDKQPLYKPSVSTRRMASKGPQSLKNYLTEIGTKRKGLEFALREQGIKISIYEFVRNMLVAAIALGVVLGFTMIILFQHAGITGARSIVLGVLLGAVVIFASFQIFLSYPTQRGKRTSKNIERDILFAARDMIISLRSGMPLFNAITSISTGYGDASKEFAKIVEKVQLGTPLEDAIDQTIATTKSASFRRIMLQATVSIRAGADVVGALQSVIDQLAQERVIELRRYGQRLNAIAMFYMLFGVILPSMGIAVVTILTTFVPLFTINQQVLEFAIVGIVFLQVIFLELILSSRPAFSM